MSDSVTITIPTEIDRRITPNGRAHWGTKGKLVKALREATDDACLAANLHLMDRLPEPPLQLHYVIVHRSKRKMLDDDNAISAMKPIRDQIAQRLHIDDRYITTGSMTQTVEPGEAYVKVAIEEATQ